MGRSVFCFLVVLGLICAGSGRNEFLEPCAFCKCPVPPEWISQNQTSCTTSGEEVTNAFCALTVFSINYCYISQNVSGIQYAGSCGCPNHCLVDTQQGICNGGQCECASGWTGPDCSQVDCEGNTCSGVGACGIVNGRDTCVCPPGRSGSACQDELHPTPQPELTFPSTQYSSWDDYGNDHPIYNLSTIAQIKLEMSAESYAFLLNPDNKDSNQYVEASFWFDNGVTTHTITSVGIRTKGNISRNFSKKTWKISLTHYDSDNEWDQVKKISLKGFQTDNSYVREVMATQVEYSMNAYIQRVGWAELYINNQTQGYYLMIEEVDGNYLKSRFGTNDGPLYKCQANLTWIGSDPNLYKNLNCGRNPCYKPQTDEAEADSGYEQLRNLLSVINLTSNDSFAEQLPKVFDVDLFIRTFVFEVATGNWDGLRDSNNFYLFQDPNDGLWKYIRHDNDGTFGALPEEMNVVTNDIYTWAASPHPTAGQFLYNRIISIPSFKKTFSQYLQKLLDGFFTPDEFSTFREMSNSYQAFSSQAVMRDIPHYLDSGYTFNTFNNSFTTNFQKPPTKVSPGQYVISIFDYMVERKLSAAAQLTEYFQTNY